MRSLSRVAVVLAVCLVILVGATFQPLVQAQDSSLVGWWRFAERNTLTVIDSSGQGNNGTLISSAIPTDDPVLGNALVLQQSGAVIIPYSASLEPATGTFEVWVNVDKPQDADVIGKTTDELLRSDYYGGFLVYGLRVKSDGRVVGIIANDDVTAKFGYPYWFTYTQTAANLIKPGKWHHLALRWDGDRLDVFVDGKQRGTSRYLPIPGTGLTYHGTLPLAMGVGTFWGDGFEHEFSGKIGDVRLYSRPRSFVEINNDFALFDAGK